MSANGVMRVVSALPRLSVLQASNTRLPSSTLQRYGQARLTGLSHLQLQPTGLCSLLTQRLELFRSQQERHFAEAAPKLSKDASAALGSIKGSMSQAKKVAQVHLSKAAKRSFPGNIRKYKLMGGREEFHNVDRNRYGRIFEPWHNFEIVISSSKNNCYITAKNKSWRYRTVFHSHAGNVGYRAAMKKSEAATYAIALNIARKLKRLGVTCAEVTFRKIMKVETCLQAFQSTGLQVTRLSHQPRLPMGDPTKPRKQRRV
eukprot:TRINITY_DN15058_c1_g1_i1.p1 TRINITY_DN15058_c1_g1~~TRINITY_DN15058_c1_g1_i1.p1  ORF type:complete len:289 (+),score=27.27 TRINITY_DN15058_c1_g1_i1:93-869(+)